MMTIRDRLENSDARRIIRSEGQTRFLQNVMQWESCDMDAAIDFCTGKTDPVHWEYTLGYKLADPVWSIGIYQQPGHRARAKAAANFRKMLTPEEDELFMAECTGKTARSVRKDFKSQIKQAKKQHKDVEVSELEGEDDD